MTNPPEKSLSPVNLNPESWLDRYMEAWLEENFERYAENWMAKRARDDKERARIALLEEYLEMRTQDKIGTVILFATNNGWFSQTAWEKVSFVPGIRGWKDVSDQHQDKLKDL
jgi:hypothetical protein